MNKVPSTKTRRPVLAGPGSYLELAQLSGRIDSGDVSIARQQTLTSLP